MAPASEDSSAECTRPKGSTSRCPFPGALRKLIYRFPRPARPPLGLAPPEVCLDPTRQAESKRSKK